MTNPELNNEALLEIAEELNGQQAEPIVTQADLELVALAEKLFRHCVTVMNKLRVRKIDVQTNISLNPTSDQFELAHFKVLKTLK